MVRTPRRQRPSSAPPRKPLRLILEALEDRLAPATITVTGTGDTIAADGVVTLRQALTAANTNAVTAMPRRGKVAASSTASSSTFPAAASRPFARRPGCLGLAGRS